MIPEELTIQGFYSYQEPQKISFSRLFQDRMFGIFGNVGSGKSSILEAMTLALYGETERLSQVDKKNYNIMNLKSNQLKIDFIFRANNKRYKFEVRGKRNLKNPGDVSLSYKKFIEENQTWIPINEEAKKILGFDYDHFKRTVIIPQGKFQEFLTLKPLERNSMMKELFFLHQFDLSEKTKIQEQIVLSKLQPIEGQLTEIGNPTEEEIQNLEKELNNTEIQISNFKQKQSELQKKVNEQELILGSINKIQETEIELKNLELEFPSILSLERKLQEWEIYKNVFQEKYINYKNTQKRILELQTRIQSLEKDLEEMKAQEESIQTDFLKKEKRMKEKEKYFRKNEEWVALGELRSVEISLKNEQENRENFLKEKTNLETQIQNLKKNLEEKKQNLINFRERLNEFTILLNRKNELLSLTRNLEEYENLKKEKTNQEQNIQNEKTKFNEKLKKLFSIDYKTEWNVSQYLENIQKQILESQKKLDTTQTLASLKILSKDLKVGDTCPLCGERIQSKQHIEKNLQIQEETNSIKQEIEKLFNLQTQLQLLEKELSILIQSGKERIFEIETKIQSLEPKLPNQKEISELEEIESKLHSLKEVQTQVSSLEKEIRTFEQELENLEKKLNQNQELYLEFQTKISTSQGKAQTLKEKISEEVFEKAKNFSLEKIKERIELQKKLLKKIPIDYEKAFQSKNEFDKQFSSKKNLLIENFNEKENLSNELQKLKLELETLFQTYKEFDFSFLEEISKTEFPLEQTRQKIQSFYQRKTTLETILQEERKKISNVENRTQELPTLKSQLQEITIELNSYFQKQGTLQTKLEDLKLRLARKKELEKERNFFEGKLARVTTLKRLFEGQGFVNYISRIFLEDLCESANERFFIFTRNQLRLELNEKGEIQVRDYMNGGNLRHIKTLSGGQLFQASLSMALALSDRIQKSHGVSESFFFLDEGFGSLDKDSLEIVFETLKSLRKENRIVGLISHVEEMKSEIRTFIWVENHPNKGSIVRMSN